MREFAARSVDVGDEPFGSVLVSADGEVLFEDHNHVLSGDGTRHPEFELTRWAGEHLTSAQRAGATVYTSATLSSPIRPARRGDPPQRPGSGRQPRFGRPLTIRRGGAGGRRPAR